MHRLLALVAVVVIAVLSGVVVAQATIPSADGTITGCYHNTTGALRIIDGDTTTCPSGQTELTWNQIGPAGVSGYEVRENTLWIEPDPDQPLPSPLPVGVDGATYEDPERVASLSTFCSAGKMAIGGGGGASIVNVSTASGRLDVVVVQSFPQPTGSGETWRLRVRRLGDALDPYVITTRVVCASIAG